MTKNEIAFFVSFIPLSLMGISLIARKIYLYLVKDINESMNYIQDAIETCKNVEADNLALIELLATANLIRFAKFSLHCLEVSTKILPVPEYRLVVSIFFRKKVLITTTNKDFAYKIFIYINQSREKILATRKKMKLYRSNRFGSEVTISPEEKTFYYLKGSSNDSQ